jgi:hypothetical protein
MLYLEEDTVRQLDGQVGSERQEISMRTSQSWSHSTPVQTQSDDIFVQK